MSTDPSLVALYQQAQEAFSTTEAGFGGDWPPPGLHDLWFVGVTDSAGQFWDSEAQSRVNCLDLRLQFEWAAPNGDRSAFDVRFQIVPNYQKIWTDENSKPHKKARMFVQQFRAAAGKLLGRTIGEDTNLLAVRNDLATLAATEPVTLVQGDVTKNGNFSNLKLVQVLTGGGSALAG